MPFFTVIIPTFNRREALREAIRSVQRQIFQDFDCWIVDDASTDGTWEMLRGMSLDARFHLHRNDANRRQHYCRNLAIRQSSSPWITFLDSDDIWLPERLARFQARIVQSPEIGFWFSNGYWLKDGRIVGWFFAPERRIPAGRLPGHYAVGDEHLPYVTTNVAVRRELFDRVGHFREDMRVLEDTELYARFLAAGTPVGVIAEKLSMYRLHPDQITVNYALQFRESMMALENSGTPPHIVERRRRRLWHDTAVFLIKSQRGPEVRRFLAESGAGRRFPMLRLASYAPPALLTLAKFLYRLNRRQPVPSPERRAAEAFLQSLTERPR